MQKEIAYLKNILCCPKCHQPLEFDENEIQCENSHFYKIVDGILIFRDKCLSSDVDLSLEKWESIYEKFLDKSEQVISQTTSSPYVKSYQRYTEKFFDLRPESVYLDMGCGVAYNSFFIAQKNIITFNVDISLAALKISKAYFDKHGLAGIFICADILDLPFKNNSFDFIFSAMSLEYFEQTEKAVQKISYLIKDGGAMFTVAPVVSFSTIYYQLSGSLPDIPLLKNIIRFVHIKLFRGKFLKHGYDKTFRKNFLRKIFNKYFKNTKLGFFEVDYELAFFKNKFLKSSVRKILRFRPFWPLIYVYVEK